MGITDSFCGSTSAFVRWMRGPFCKKWDEEQAAKQPTPAPAPSTPAPSSPAPAPTPAPVSAPLPPANSNPSSQPDNAPVTTPPAVQSEHDLSPKDDASFLQTPTLPDTNDQPSPFPDTTTLPSRTPGTNNPFPENRVSGAKAAEQSASDVPIYAGIGVAVVIAIALLAFLFVRVVRNRRRQQQERSLALLAGQTDVPTDLPPPKLLEAQSVPMYAAEPDIEAGLRPAGEPVRMNTTLPMPVPVTEMQQAPAHNDFLFDASNDMRAAGLGESSTVPYANVAAGVSSHSLPGYAVPDVALAHDHNPIASGNVPDEAFGEHIYGDMSTLAIPQTFSTNEVRAADISTSSTTGAVVGGYCNESLRGDTMYMQPENTPMGTYGSDAVYLDATEEFPEVPPMSPKQAQQKV
ncbi:hypothetical protein THASP1DRAFT_28901 [Thamnocephalis sphaerospora]|uniref:Uncharacterized protein n=1 Tax=Thamnocephalis sphaerospora TaxID=78915 RepID=A0A4P9XT27_9FUNG|nr:hypothetical protein THASP1DRAFT_28901 [Thamnocephalis sphaerospora]|eukprot:RKP09297.1 hypothetical protein THASP1DRAFT_28901 [Thamnocephalis sphaerospora]